MIKKGLNITKCCGVCYYESDINSIVDFCLKKGFRYYYIKHIGASQESMPCVLTNTTTDTQYSQNNSADTPTETSENVDKKVHWHFIIESDSQHRFIINSLISETLKENLFQKLDNVHSYLRYMTHIDYIYKEHYQINEIKSNVSIDIITDYINEVIVDKDLINRECFNTLLDLILSHDLTNFKEVIMYCRKNDIQFKTSWTNTLVQLLKS